MQKMIADMRFTYDRRDIAPGDEFMASDNDALALRAYRRAHLAEEPQEKPRSRRTYKRRDMRAES
jgi:hypothetical protein